MRVSTKAVHLLAQRAKDQAIPPSVYVRQLLYRDLGLIKDH